MIQNTYNWKGQSGNLHTYRIMDINTYWNDVPGNYIFAQKEGTTWRAIYVGQTSSFRNRLPDHEKRPCSILNGATHIHAHVNNLGENARKAEEADLIKLHQSVCNELLK